MKTVSMGFLRRAGRHVALPAIAIAAASAAAPAHAQTIACQTAARLEVGTTGTAPRYLSFRIYNLHAGALTVKITVGKVELPWVAMNPLLDHSLRQGRSVAYAFASTVDPTAAMPAYEFVYDGQANPTQPQIGIQDCVGS